MKKIIAMLLAIVMVCALSVSVFAAPTAENTTAPVKGTYSQADHAEVAYVIDISWGAMACTWTIGAKEWDTNTHTWKDPAAGGVWSYTGNTITITNDSSVGITAYATYAAEEGFEGISGSFKDENEVDVNAGAPAALAKPVGGNETTATLTLALAGALAEGTADATTIGNITITLADAA